MEDKAFAVTVSFGGCDAAFAENWRHESARLLRKVADLIETCEVNPGHKAGLFDINGNNIGSYSISK